MPGTAAPADDSSRSSSPASPPPISPILKSKINDLAPEIAAKVRAVVARK
jgi:hypothetical protein